MVDDTKEEEEEEEEREDGNTSLELINQYHQSNQIKRFCQTIVEFFLFAFAVDPFAIYKAPTYKHRDAKRFRMYQTEALRIELNQLDKWRWRWRIVLRVGVIYYCLKFSAIIFVQLALHASRSTTTAANGRSDWEVMLDKPGPLVEWAKLLGNPLIQLPGSTIFIYGLTVALLSYTVIYLFHYYTIEPFDSALIRLWLEPAREFRRIDMSILRKLDYFDSLGERTCRCRMKDKRRKYETIVMDYALVESREIQRQTISLFRRHHWYLRPVIFGAHWYKAFTQYGIIIAMPVVLGVAAFVLGCMQPLLNYLFLNEKTNELEWSRLSFYQTITLVDALASFMFLIPMALFMIIILSCLWYSHLAILFDIRSYLLTCLSDLRRLNGGQLESLDQVEPICILLRPLIRVSLSLDELRTNAKFWSEIVSINVVLSGTTCVCILLAGYLDGENLADFRFVVISFLWFWSNVVLLTCAYSHTSAIKLEPITRSMVAELRFKESRNDWLLFEHQLTEFWQRLILNRCFSDSLIAVRPFGITFNYHRVMQLNFLAISFASILKSF